MYMEDRGLIIADQMRPPPYGAEIHKLLRSPRGIPGHEPSYHLSDSTSVWPYRRFSAFDVLLLIVSHVRDCRSTC